MDAATLASFGLAIIAIRKKQKIKRRRSIWVKDWLRRRTMYGVGTQLFKELSEEEPRDFKN